MMWNVLLGVLLTLVVVAMVVSVLWYARRGQYARRVLVNLKTGNAIEGVLVHEDRAAMTLADAELHIPDRDSAPIDGRTVVFRGEVEFYQVLTSKAPA